MVDLFQYSLENAQDIDKFDLECSFVCAKLSALAYESRSIQTKFLSSYGFTDTKVLIKRKSNVTLTRFNNIIFIAFMGTDFNNINDLVDNVRMIWSNEGSGKVHAGYKDHVDLFWTDIKNYIQSVPHEQIIVTGHSMGGACGQIVNNRLPNTIGYYFGSTRCVDSVIQKSSSSTIFQLRHKYDVVAHFPLRVFGFCRLGETLVIKNAVIVSKTPRWYDMAYSLLYTLIYFIMVGITKATGTKSHLINKVLINHQIDGYIKNIENVVKITNQQ